MFLLILCSSDCRRTGLSSFTFHDVSINTIRKTKPAKKFHNFTFHDVSINTIITQLYVFAFITLHSTMFLLIQESEGFNLYCLPVFTFHDVSINTVGAYLTAYLGDTLHSTMFLLIRRQQRVS